MNVFAVLINEPDDRVLEQLKERYGTENLYLVNTTAILLRTAGLADDIAVSAGIKGGDRFATGVVFKLNRAYAGYTARSLWEWLQEVES